MHATVQDAATLLSALFNASTRKMPEGLEVAALARALRQAGLDAANVAAHGKHVFAQACDWSFGLSGRVQLRRSHHDTWPSRSPGGAHFTSHSAPMPPAIGTPGSGAGDAAASDGGCTASGAAIAAVASTSPAPAPASPVRAPALELTRPPWTGGVCGKTVPVASLTDMVAGAKLGLDWCTATREQLAAATSSWNHSRKQLGALLLDQHIIAGIGVAWGSEILARAGNLRPELPARVQSLVGLVQAMCDVRDAAWAVYAKAVDDAADKVQFVNEWFENLYAVRTMAVYYNGDGTCEAVKAGARTWWVRTAAARGAGTPA